MKFYSGIDLHSNNSVVGVYDEQGHAAVERRVTNDLDLINKLLEPYKNDLVGVVVESTYNWYWLVDGLQELGYLVHLAHTAGNVQYSGMKYTDDFSDARWLAELLRLGILKEGYIYPKKQRECRDLLRQRSRLVQERSRHILSVQNIVARETGRSISSNQIKRLSKDSKKWLEQFSFAVAIRSRLEVINVLDQQIENIELMVLEQVKSTDEFKHLLTMPGVGKILGLTVWLETGQVQRFAGPGNFASYARCVDSKRVSNGKKKGENNAKNGNRYLAWAFVEAANFAIRYNPMVKRFYERKKAKRNGVLAIKSVAHKLARAAFYIMRNGTDFDMKKVFI
jgi:transposase